MPIKSPDAVRKQIAAGRVDPVYLLLGEDEAELSALASAFAGLVEEDLRAFNVDRFYATDKGVTPDAVVDVARTLPMMAPRRVVIVMRAERWLKPRRAGLEGAPVSDEDDGGREAGALERYVAAPVEESTLVLVAADANKSVRAVKALYKHGTVVEAWGLKTDREIRGGRDLADAGRRAYAWIQREAKASGRAIEPEAARLLAERAGADIGRLRADMERLLLFVGDRTRLTRQDAEEVASERTAQDRWAVPNALERGDAPTALRELALALDSGVVPYLMLGQLAWFARDKLPALNPAAVRDAVNAVFRTDLDIKSSGGDPRVLLERLVVELCEAVTPTRASGGPRSATYTAPPRSRG